MPLVPPLVSSLLPPPVSSLLLPPLPPLLALAPGLGWTLGILAGVGLAIYGGRLLRALARREVLWWSSVAAPLLLIGPALGLLLGCWLTEHPLTWGGAPAQVPANVAWSILLFFGVAAVIDITKAFLQSPFVTEQVGVRLPDLVIDAFRYVLYLVTVFVIIVQVWKKDDLLTPLYTASALGTVIVGFAMQETLANFFAGMSLLAERSYAIGDWIWIGENEGEVVAISRRSTRLKNRQGDMVTLSNRLVAGGVLRNQSKPTSLHAEVIHVAAPYETPPNRVREVLRRAMQDVEGLLRDPAPLVRLGRFGDSGVEYQVKVWLTDVAHVPDILSEARVQVWYHLHRAGISIPFPIREVRRSSAPVAEQGLGAEAVRERLAGALLFRGLPPDALETLARGAHAEGFAAGERVVRQGARGRSCYVVDAGRVAVLLEEGGTTRTVATLGPGDVFGEMSLLTGQDRSATVKTLTDARLVEVEAGALEEALHLAPDLATHLAEVVTLRQEGLLEARAAMGAEARARVAAGTLRLGAMIRQFFRLPPAS